MDIPIPIIWASIGIILLIAEVFTASFFVLFFGISALIVALITFFGLDHRAIEIALFAAIGLMSLFLFRKKLVKSFSSKGIVQGDHDKVIKLDQDIEPRGESQISYQGSSWKAINNSDTRMMSGERVKIERIDGIKIILNHIQ